MKNLYLIVNPHGGLKKGLRILEKVKPIFEQEKIALKILKTEYAGHAQNIVVNLILKDLMVCVRLGVMVRCMNL